MLAYLLASMVLQPAPEPPPVTPPRQIAGSISDADYPAAAIVAEEQGTTAIMIDVDATGKVAACTPAGSSGSSALDTASCALVTQRFRYEPARNAEGQPTRASIRRTITWRLPAGDKIGFRSFSIAIQAELKDGVIVGCHQEELDVHETLCREAFTPLLAWLNAQGNVTNVTFFMAFTPDGDVPPVIRSEWGRKIIGYEIALVLRPDGSTESCTVTHVQPPPGAPGAVDPCHDSGGTKSLFGPGEGPELRRGKMLMATFVNRGP